MSQTETRGAAVTSAEYRRDLLEKLAAVEKLIESHKATLALLEIERGRIRYMLNVYVRTVPRAET
jgi:hypothetical protein